MPSRQTIQQVLGDYDVSTVTEFYEKISTTTDVTLEERDSLAQTLRTSGTFVHGEDNRVMLVTTEGFFDEMVFECRAEDGPNCYSLTFEEAVYVCDTLLANQPITFNTWITIKDYVLTVEDLEFTSDTAEDVENVICELLAETVLAIYDNRVCEVDRLQEN